jgi:hypothetical protein
MAFLAILASYVVDAQRGRKTAEAGPARYLAKLFGSGDTAADYGAAGAGT